MFKNFQKWVAEYRYLIVYMTVVATSLCAAYLYRIGTFVNTDNVYESAEYLNAGSIGAIISDISNAPIRTIQRLLLLIDDNGVLLLRILSFLIVLLSLIVFYRLISKWHTHQVAMISTFLLATSTFSLHLGRFANTDALYYLVIPLLLLIGTWLKSKRYVVRLPFVFPALALLLYLPGIVYLLIPLPILFRKRLLLAWRNVDFRYSIISLAASVLLLVPLVYSLIIHPSQLYKYFALDEVFSSQSSYSQLLQNALDTVTALFINGPNEPWRWLYGTPVLDIASVALLVLGVYSYLRGPHTLRSRLLALLGTISLLLIVSSSIIGLAIILPLLYIVIANGLSYLLISWFTVFPRNPAARNAAIAVLIVFVALIASYHLQRYFIAWPNSPESQSSLEAK